MLAGRDREGESALWWGVVAPVSPFPSLHPGRISGTCSEVPGTFSTPQGLGLDPIWKPYRISCLNHQVMGLALNLAVSFLNTQQPSPRGLTTI